MKTKRKNYVAVTILSILMLVLFLVHSAIAEKAPPTSVPEKAVVEMVDDGQAASNINSHTDNKETNEAKNVQYQCEFKKENSVAGKISLATPYEIISGDYFGMLAKFFDHTTC
jgi:hypothetical protein